MPASPIELKISFPDLDMNSGRRESSASRWGLATILVLYFVFCTAVPYFITAISRILDIILQWASQNLA